MEFKKKKKMGENRFPRLYISKSYKRDMFVNICVEIVMKK